MSNILLISPPEKQTLMEAGDRPPLGIMYVAGEVNRTKRHSAFISDLNHDSYKTLTEKINTIKPEYIGITTSTPYFYWWTNFSKHLHHNYPNIKLIAGGPHATVMPYETNQYFNYVVVGDGEKIAVDILDGRLSEGIYQYPFSNLDDLAGPDWQTIDMKNYGLNQEGLKTMTILSSRSCSQHCFFCTKNALGKTQRIQTAYKTIEEIEYLKMLGFHSFYFVDDCFTENKKRTLELTSALKPLRITYRATSRTDRLDEELIDALANSGMRSISFGLEHMDNDVLKRIQKNNTMENNTHAVQLARSRGLKIRGSFILNLPGATATSMYECVNFAIDNKLDFADFYSLIAYPGTPIWNYPERYNGKILDKNYTFFQTAGKTNVEFEMPLDKFYLIAEDIRNRWKKFKGTDCPWEMLKQ
jgi:anaerobic magnesium-protoporphyrin IX monomethyl ester cyclase